MKKVVSFLLIAAMALSMIGCGNAADTTTVAPETTKAPETTVATEETTEAPAADLNCEIVVVGAGGAGMVSALQAVENGAESVIIVEKNWMVGGNSILSTGGMNAAETPNQDANEFKASAGVEKTLNTAATAWADNATVQALAATVQAQYDAYKANPEGYFDSVELMMLDTLIGGNGINDMTLVETLAKNSADGIAWLKDAQNADLVQVGAFGGASVNRIHKPVNAEGKTVSVGGYLVPILEKNCLDNEKITILYETKATEILVVDGAAAGIVVTDANGSYKINAEAVILASGGFGANNDMVASYQPNFKGYISTNNANITGDGIVMAQAIGAAVVDMEQIQLHPTVYQKTAALITEGLRGDGAILVNKEGLRFYDEVSTRDKVSAAEFAQTGGVAYLIVDQAMYDKSAVIAGYDAKGMMIKGETYEELAANVGMTDAAAFAATMEKWNNCVEAGVDEEFGRTSFANKLDTAPYYAIEVGPGVHHTMGGLKINANAEVISTEGAVIAGLYAAGEITGGVHGGNRLGGNAVADIVVFGRIAGASAQSYTSGK